MCIVPTCVYELFSKMFCHRNNIILTCCWTRSFIGLCWRHGQNNGQNQGCCHHFHTLQQQKNIFFSLSSMAFKWMLVSKCLFYCNLIFYKCWAIVWYKKEYRYIDKSPVHCWILNELSQPFLWYRVDSMRTNCTCTITQSLFFIIGSSSWLGKHPREHVYCLSLLVL